MFEMDSFQLVSGAAAPVTHVLWPFDLNTNDFYNVYNGIPLNNPTYVSSPVSTTAIHLRSSLKQSVAITLPFLNFARTSFTVECWIHPTLLSAYDNAILGQCQDQSNSYCLHLGLRNASIYLGFNEDNLKGNSVLRANNWYHLAFVFNAASLRLTIYLNGKQDGTKTYSNSYQGTGGSLTIGTSKHSRTHQTYFDGYIDQLSFVSLAKSAEEILNDATTIGTQTTRWPVENPSDGFELPSSTNCDAHLATIKQQAKAMEQQIIATKEVLHMSMETIAGILERQQKGKTCEGGASSGVGSSNSCSSTAPSHDFTPPNRRWCPWRSDCTQTLDRRGQVTIEMDQEASLPFELHLSVSDHPTNGSYVLHLSVDKNRVLVFKTMDGVTTTINQTTEQESVLHEEKGKYWLSIDYANLFVKYGQGEVRDRCTLLKSDLSKDEQERVRRIQFVHISFNNSREIAELKKYEHKIKLKVGKNPVVDDPALVVVAPTAFSLEHHRDNTGMLVTRLDEPCRALYSDVMNWKFQDDDFPYLFEAIEQSIRNESGWCRRTLNRKANRFGKPNILATYLRISVGRSKGNSPGVPYVLEVWPPGHYSPIHTHANTYGIIRVLHGEVNVKFYRTLNLKRQKPILETNIVENQVTWLSPGLNQIHKLENKSPSKTCITIQAYEYRHDEVSNYEYFDYINNNGLSIDKFDPVSDMDYFEFKKKMSDEWNNRV